MDPVFKQSIEEFSTNSLPRIYELIEKYRKGRQVVIFKSREDMDEFLSKTQEGIT